MRFWEEAKYIASQDPVSYTHLDVYKRQINAMATSTAKLPKIELQVPQKALGKNTNDALESGIIYGFVGQIDGIVKRLKAEMGGEVKVIATGGMAKVIADISETIDVVDPLLTLDGLNYIFRKSINKA